VVSIPGAGAKVPADVGTMGTATTATGLAATGRAATGTHGAGCQPAHPAEAMARVKITERERINRIREFRPGSFERAPINAQYG
jgi:hypothetical protein